MPRVIVDLPDRFVFATEIPILTSHINYARHLDNAALLSLVSEARARLFVAMGHAELNIDGLGVIVADAAVQYRSEAFYGDVLVFEVAAADFNKYGCDLVWRATAKADGREVARGKTGILFFDYEGRKKAAPPAVFLDYMGR